MKRRGFFQAIAAGLFAALLPAPEPRQLTTAGFVADARVSALDFDEMLTPAQAERFMRYVIEMSTLASNAKVVPFRTDGKRLTFV